MYRQPRLVVFMLVDLLLFALSVNWILYINGEEKPWCGVLLHTQLLACVGHA